MCPGFVPGDDSVEELISGRPVLSQEILADLSPILLLILGEFSGNPSGADFAVAQLPDHVDH